MSAELVLIRGLPGSGKSTMARMLKVAGFEHYEADMFFERDGAYAFDGERLVEAHDWCAQQARRVLSRGARVVVANTFTRRWEMTRYFALVAEFGAQVQVIEATGKWRNSHGVPDTAVDRMRERWEHLEISSLALDPSVHPAQPSWLRASVPPMR